MFESNRLLSQFFPRTKPVFSTSKSPSAGGHRLPVHPLSMDLYVAERQLRAAEADLRDAVRHGEVSPSEFCALRCERLHRTVMALKHRRKQLLRAAQGMRPHVVSAEAARATRDLHKMAMNPAQLAKNANQMAKTSRRKTRRSERETSWDKWVQSEDEEEEEEEEAYWEKNDENTPLPMNLRRRRREKWLQSEEERLEDAWEWNGRALKVVRNVVDNDAELVERLHMRTNELEKRIKDLLDEKSGEVGLEMEMELGEREKAKGEVLAEERVRAREAARRELQEHARMLRVELEHNSAAAVQSVFRGHLGRKRLRQAREKNVVEMRHEKASIVQSQFRGYLVRRDLSAKRKAAELETQHAAAMVIQSQTRGRAARKKFGTARGKKEREKYAAMMIQAWWRGYTGRARVGQIRKEWHRKAEEMYAIMLQCAWRSYKARKMYIELKQERDLAYEEAAAIMLQAAWRGYQARAKMKSIKDELELTEARAREMDYAERVKLTYYAKQFLDKQHRAVLLVQSLFRGFKDRQYMKTYLAKKRKEKQEEEEIDRLLESERKAKEKEKEKVPTSKEPERKFIFDDVVEMPLDRNGHTRAMVNVHILVWEVKNPYRLKVEAEETSSGQIFRREINTGVLVELLEPLFANEHPSLREKDSGPILDLILHGIPPQRKQLIRWIIRRMWVDQTVDGELDLCLGSLPPEGLEGTAQLDRSLTAAIPPRSPPSSPIRSPALGGLTTSSRALEDLLSVSRTEPKKKSKKKNTRDAYVVRYA